MSWREKPADATPASQVHLELIEPLLRDLQRQFEEKASTGTFSGEASTDYVLRWLDDAAVADQESALLAGCAWQTRIVEDLEIDPQQETPFPMPGYEIAQIAIFRLLGSALASRFPDMAEELDRGATIEFTDMGVEVGQEEQARPEEEMITAVRLYRATLGRTLFGRAKDVWMLDYVDAAGRVLATRPTSFPGKANGLAVLAAVEGALTEKGARVYIDRIEPEAKNQP
ncbi:MAG: hypothetical protein WD757_03830 [Actinomycetota bacterium]